MIALRAVALALLLVACDDATGIDTVDLPDTVEAPVRPLGTADGGAGE